MKYKVLSNINMVLFLYQNFKKVKYIDADADKLRSTYIKNKFDQINSFNNFLWITNPINHTRLIFKVYTIKFNKF